MRGDFLPVRCVFILSDCNFLLKIMAACAKIYIEHTYLLWKQVCTMLNSIKVSPTRIRLNGSVAAQRNYRAQVADDLRVFLSKHEGRYIYPEDIKNFYSQRFPNLRFSVKNANPGNRNEGITVHKVNRDTLKHESCVIQVRSQSLMDRVKKIFNRDNHRHELYVDSNFADVMTHEGTHMMQYYMKPIYHNYYSTLLKLVGNDKTKLFDLVKAQDKIYDKMVYCSDLGFTPKKFRAGLNTMLDEVSENNPQQKLAHLKFMIRNAVFMGFTRDLELSNTPILRQTMQDL